MPGSSCPLQTLGQRFNQKFKKVKQASWPQRLRQLDQKLDKLAPLLLLILLLALLRLPNFTEPYWYGDEAIYLTVGQALKYGQKLYAQIVDHKTPLIYYLAMVPNQFWFRVLNFTWMTGATILFFNLAQKLLSQRWAAWLAGVIFVVLTSVPWFEGNIPNGELFVLGFVLTGLFAFSHSKYWSWLVKPTRLVKPAGQKPGNELRTEQTKTKSTPAANQQISKPSFKPGLFLAGVGLGLAILTKVPALLDLGAVLLIGWFYLVRTSWQQIQAGQNKLGRLVQQVVLDFGYLLLGVGVTIGISVLYFVIQGSGADYLQYGLLYNLHYSQSWQPQFNWPLLAILFTLPGKLVVLSLALIIITALSQRLSRRFQFIISWLLLTLFAALLSNRPYPHYYQQLVPAFSLLIAYYASQAHTYFKGKLKQAGCELLLGLSSLTLVIAASLALNFQPYPTLSYYQNFVAYSLGKIDQSQYYRRFNSITTSNYHLAAFLKKQDIRQLFIWGTNPMLYAQSKTMPTGKFTVSFHIKDVKAYDGTMHNLKKQRPLYIVVMNNERGKFPEFYQYLYQNYHLERQYPEMKLYARNST
jgi:hypothetical protein